MGVACDDNAILVSFHKLDKTAYIGICLDKSQVIVIRSCGFVAAAPACDICMLDNKDVFAIVIVLLEKSLKPVKLSS